MKIDKIFKDNNNSRFSEPANKSAGILDDFAVRKTINTKELYVNGVAVGGSQSLYKETFVLASGTAATTGNNKTNVLTVPYSGTIVKCKAYAKTAPVGAALICDINIDGSTIWSSQANRITIADGANSGTQSSFNTTAVVEGDLFTIDIDQVGSGTAGQDITIELFLLMNNS